MIDNAEILSSFRKIYTKELMLKTEYQVKYATVLDKDITKKV